MTVTNKVVTITLNPALDLTGSLDTLNKGSVSLVNQGSLHAAGKGVNVAKVLSDLGADVTVTGFLGTDNQELFCQLFADMGAQDRFVRVAGSTRINVKLVEVNGDVSDINFPGVEVNTDAIDAFEQTLNELMKEHDYFVFAGSLPRGITPEQCAVWIELLQENGKRVLFDSSRDALAKGLDSKPWLIKPNDEELSQFVGRHLTTQEQCLEAAESLSDKGIANIVVSMGAEGVLWLENGEWLQAKPPRMSIVSTVGAGDTLVAGLCWGHMQSKPKTELLSFATALSALAVSQVGVGVSDVNEVLSLQQKIELQKLSH
ncbi:1-phosphofructokinase [Vibrio sp. SCSIO 43140]|uniref:1-phosphofructokinase n=1 Tax=Vibrio sp. SCSIO 43140 TaxID=2819100 RepID=UPI002075DD30|nr:1-phosphofructokinase [Vibrio sp. SCSIO 43140]USD62607.1 1-phosphofructokinase [Vibrio sp. SCSIO 43140]